MFPRLADAQIARIANHGKLRSQVRRGEVLFSEGEQFIASFNVVISGSVEVVQVRGR